MTNDQLLTNETRRLLLAGLALQGILQKAVNIGEDTAIQQQAGTAVRYVDALLARLNSPTGR